MVLFLVKHKTNKIFRLCFLMAQTHFLEQYRFLNIAHDSVVCDTNVQHFFYVASDIF